MSKNCNQCSQRKGRKYYLIDDFGMTIKMRCCDKCKPNFPILEHTSKQQALLATITNALL